MAGALRSLGFAFANADLLLEVDDDLRIVFAAGAGNALLASDADAFRGRHLADLFPPSDRALVVRAVRSLGANTRLEPRLVHLTRGPDNLECRLGAYRVEEGGPRYVTLIRETAAPLPVRPEVDPATGTRTARTFADMVAAGFGLDPLHRRRRTLTLLRLDNLPDILGRLDEAHVARLMQEVGGILRFHAGDGIVGRLGDDRFGIIHREDPDLAARVCRDLAAVGDAAGLTASHESLTPADLTVTREDAGRILLHVVQLFAAGGLDPSGISQGATLAAVVRATVERVAVMRRTLAERRLSLHYQPIIHLESNTIHHHEALLRFQDGASTIDAITFAEQVGIISDLDLMICSTALDALKAGPRHSRIAVNLSGVSLSSDVFMQSLQRLLAGAGRERRRLLFEITESACIHDLDRVARIVRWMRDKGHIVCLDDFGAGAAQLPYLQAFDVDFVKLDGSFIDGLGATPRNDLLVENLVRLMSSLGIDTIAERVETPAQAGVLKRMGCGFAQGWHFGRPAPTIVIPHTAGQPLARLQGPGVARRGAAAAGSRP